MFFVIVNLTDQHMKNALFGPFENFENAFGFGIDRFPVDQWTINETYPATVVDKFMPFV